jgi:ABC-type transport system involved in Fe-S cluster assembly fused permease/ATPase subunit
MRALRLDGTSGVVVHWLSTIRDAYVILVLESWRIVEQGNRGRLLAAQGAMVLRCAT